MPLFNPGIDATGGTITGSLTVGADLQVDNNMSCTNDLSVGGVTTATGITTTQDGIIMATVGTGLSIKEGVNAKMGTGTLNGATEVTISTTAVSATSRVFLSIQVPHGTPVGSIYVSSRVAGTSFGVKGTALDTSDFAWMIVDPA